MSVQPVWAFIVSPRNGTEQRASHLAGRKWKPRDEGYRILLAIIDNVVSLTIGKAVAILHRDDGHDLPGTFDMLTGNVGQVSSSLRIRSDPDKNTLSLGLGASRSGLLLAYSPR